MTDQRVNTTRCSIDNFAQIVEANFLCRDECVTTQSVKDFGHGFDVLIANFASYAKYSAKFPLVKTRCISVVGVCTWTCISMISSRDTQVLYRRNSRGNHGATIKRKEIDHSVRSRSLLYLKQASSLCCCTMRTWRWSWIKEGNNNSAPLPMWAGCAVDDRCNPMWWLMCKQHSNTRHKCKGKMSQLLRLFEWLQVNLVAQLPSGCVRWSMLFGCWGCWGSVGSFFLAVLTCAGQFEDVSVVVWVDRVVLWWFFTRFYVVASWKDVSSWRKLFQVVAIG